MFTLPNAITLLRLPLAFAFLQSNVWVRVLALLMAMASDAIDGYLARRYGSISRLGTLLDPLMDKLFVAFVLSVFYYEQRVDLFEIAAMLCRDFSVVIFGFYLAAKGALGTYRFQAIWCGKVTTLLQFSVLLALSVNMTLPSWIYSAFIFLGLLALGELYLTLYKKKNHISEG